MSVRIRLTRIGAKKRPYYRIVAADSEAPRDGRFLEILGSYDPNPTPAQVEVKADKLAKWLEKGAKPSTTVFSLLKNNGLWPGDKSPAASPAG